MIINVGRPSIWGNQFRIGPDGTRAEVVVKHRAWFLAPEQASLRAKARKELRGQELWCPGCKGTTPCHRLVLEEVANC